MQVSNFMKIHPVGAELFHLDGQTDMTKLVVAFYNFVNAPKKKDPVLSTAMCTLRHLLVAQNICTFKQLTVAIHMYVNLDHSKI